MLSKSLALFGAKSQLLWQSHICMKSEGFLERRSNFLKNTVTSCSLGELPACSPELLLLYAPAWYLAAPFGPGEAAGVRPGCCTPLLSTAL